MTCAFLWSLQIKINNFSILHSLQIYEFIKQIQKNPTEVQVFFCNYPLYDLHNFPMNYVFKSFKISIIQRLASHIYWIISNCLNAKIRIKYSKNLVFSARIFYLNLIHFLLNDSFFLIFLTLPLNLNLEHKRFGTPCS